jgi:NADPH:quinone reductase-like Zn-dependent oxidoreductase
MARLIAKRLQIIGSIMRILPLEEKFMIRDRFMQKWMPVLEEGKIAPVLDRVFDIRDAEAAHKHMQQSKHIGKILLRVT